MSDFKEHVKGLISLEENIGKKVAFQTCLDYIKYLEGLLQLQQDLPKCITRLEIIDHTIANNNRCFVKHVDYDYIVSPELQDNGKTLKLFLSEIKQENNNDV